MWTLGEYGSSKSLPQSSFWTVEKLHFGAGSHILPACQWHKMVSRGLKGSGAALPPWISGMLGVSFCSGTHPGEG